MFRLNIICPSLHLLFTETGADVECGVGTKLDAASSSCVVDLDQLGELQDQAAIRNARAEAKPSIKARNLLFVIYSIYPVLCTIICHPSHTHTHILGYAPARWAADPLAAAPGCDFCDCITTLSLFSVLSLQSLNVSHSPVVSALSPISRLPMAML
jgi:hypothetical protein